MRRVAPALVFLWACAVASAVVPPTVLVAQLKAPPTDGVDHNLIVDDRMAAALDQIGQVNPVVWSLADAYIRAANDERRIVFKEDASEKDIRAAAERLRIPYVLFLTVFKDGDSLRPIAYLYNGRSNRPSWRFGEYDSKSQYRPRLFVDGKSQTNVGQFGEVGKVFETMVVLADGKPDWESTALTLARSWAEVLGDTVFKDLPRRPQLTRPVADHDHQGGTVAIDPAPSDALERQMNQLLAEGKTALAILTLQEAIDRSPYNTEPRLLLVRLLTRQGLYDEAAKEARRTARLMPDDVSLWLRSARAWLVAGKPGEAQTDLNEATRRNAKAVASMAVLGDILLAQNRLTDAVQAYSASMSAGPTPEAVVGLAVAKGLLGDAEGCKKELDTLAGANPETLERTYLRAVELIDQASNQVSAACRELIPLARHSPKTTDVIARAVVVRARTLALSNLVSNLPVPGRFKNSHAERDLAQKLLAQCGQEILDFAQSGDEDLGDEATLSLGEALDRVPMVKALFDDENKI